LQALAESLQAKLSQFEHENASWQDQFEAASAAIVEQKSIAKTAEFQLSELAAKFAGIEKVQRSYSFFVTIF